MKSTLHPTSANGHDDRSPIPYTLADPADDVDHGLHPVDSTYCRCCGGLGAHGPDCTALGDVPDVGINRVARRAYVEIDDCGHLLRLTAAGARELADCLLEAADAADAPAVTR